MSLVLIWVKPSTHTFLGMPQMRMRNRKVLSLYNGNSLTINLLLLILIISLTIALQLHLQAHERGVAPEHVSRHYALGALTLILPTLTEILARQESETNDDEWIPAKAAGVCVMQLAQCSGDAIIEPILPFITKHFTNSDWFDFLSLIKKYLAEKNKRAILKLNFLLLGITEKQQSWLLVQFLKVLQS